MCVHSVLTLAFCCCLLILINLKSSILSSLLSSRLVYYFFSMKPYLILSTKQTYLSYTYSVKYPGEFLKIHFESGNKWSCSFFFGPEDYKNILTKLLLAHMLNIQENSLRFTLKAGINGHVLSFLDQKTIRIF